MITFQLTKEQIEGMEANLKICVGLLDNVETETERDLINAYNDLAKAIAGGILADGQMIMVGREERLGDTLDRPTMHNINIANRPSDMQLKAYQEEHDEEH